MKTNTISQMVLEKAGVEIGAETFPDKKRPAIVITKGHQTTVYGYVKDEKCAEVFMRELAELVGAKRMEG